MIRPFTCVCLLLAAGSGLYLYQTKHQTQMVDRDIERTLKAADATWQRSGVLHAEYALLNDPSRLADLAGQYLPSLQTTAPGQFSTWTDLDRRLPAVGAAPPEPPPLDAAAPVPAPPPEDEIAKPEPPRPEPPHIDPPRAVVASLPTRPPAPAPEAAPAQPRPVVIAPPRVATPAPVRPVMMPVQIAPPVAAAARPEPAPAPAEAVTRIARGGAVEPSVPAVASALGMARSMLVPPAPVTPTYAGPQGPGGLR